MRNRKPGNTGTGKLAQHSSFNQNQLVHHKMCDSRVFYTWGCVRAIYFRVTIIHRLRRKIEGEHNRNGGHNSDKLLHTPNRSSGGKGNYKGEVNIPGMNLDIIFNKRGIYSD